jgi:hypothetical protein
MSNEEQDKRELEQLRSEAAKDMPDAELQGASTDCPTVTPEEVEVAIAAGFLGAVAFRQGQAKRKLLLSYADFHCILDDEAEDIGVDDDTQDGKYAWNAMNAAGNAIREFYESKITSGELITKEQAEAMVQKAVNEYAQDRANDEA